ncbi:uncharacterized protein LOC101860469 [Aplysia californica]|uniref:Uncharacterized protein LOC101860469 n=1 Tax=Aplysia californica TaxID=6500 RepID=A0ABM1W1K3_APLCA|nr:uncharacterized protein LOC101860469 [Aplysia californica]
MFFRIIRGALVLVTTAVAIPYTVAIVSNILHGWPQMKHKYRRALSPRKVMGLNYVIIQMLRDKTKLLPLYLKFKKFYKNADPRRVYKNLAFGRNDCTLDLYLPCDRDPSQRLPVIIFVYGGSWSSGDKSMYGLLCSQLVAKTGAVTICPNYSVHPKGYVDDMIQDVVDCISWVLDNIEEYGGDKNKIILIGHSAGAHLSAMAILELLHDERVSVQPGFRFQPAGGQMDELAFAESHYGRLSTLERNREGLEDSSGSSESFAVVSENGGALEQSMGGSLENSGGAASLLGSSINSEFLESSANSEGLSSLSASTVMVEAGDGDAPGGEESQLTEAAVDSMAGAGQELLGAGDAEDKAIAAQDAEEVKIEQRLTPKSGSLGDDEEEIDDDSGDNDSVVTVKPKDIDRHATLVDMCKAVKAFIGLAGVYSIRDHFEHEAMRGIEDVSSMARAHYGEDHFERFSPTEILRSLGRGLSLPVMVLVHGSDDYIAPVSATQKFASALAEISASVKVKIIPDCNHYEICVDLMESQRKFYSHVMGVVMETVAAVS